MLPKQVELIEVGPREGFQFEGIGQPDRIPTADKIRLIEALAETGATTIQSVSFVHPKQVPQMADAEEIIARLRQKPGVKYTAVYLNDVGIKRAMAAGKLHIVGSITLAASETFSLRNQKRNYEQDYEMQRKVAALYQSHGMPVQQASMQAAFGCNYEGEVPLERVLRLTGQMIDIAAEFGGELRLMSYADTMGWANPEQIRRTIGAVRERWPDLRLRLHLHDTRGLAIANTYAALLEGVDSFDTAVAGLGGCPFAGHKAAAGNVCSEEVVFLCEQLGIETGIDLSRLVECSRLAQEIVGHPVPSTLVNAGESFRMPERLAS